MTKNQEPLTLEQLKQRIGKPVYIVYDNDDFGDWYILRSITDEYANRYIRLNDHTGVPLSTVVSGTNKFYDHEPNKELLEEVL